MRSLTYRTEIFCAVELKKIQYGEKNPKTGVKPILDEKTLFKDDKVQIGKIPVMVRSKFCHLSTLHKDQIVNDQKECRYDQGGYFIINGNEKVLVAQERMAANIVLVFHKKSTDKYEWVAEIRSAAENSLKPPQSFTVMLTHKNKSGFQGQFIEAQIPMIKRPIPVVILMRALNIIGDK